ncbi:MAG: hypothetical protein GF331_19255 [Chitinivibrionales bacterium]|nr:hypothetical protein [Chitinivibrionales bacterium]
MNKSALLSVALLAACLRAAPPPDMCRQATWVTDGTVDAVCTIGDKVYLGGDFNLVGPYTGGAAAISTATAQTAATFPKVHGLVTAVCPDGAGGWYLGGEFTAVDSVARRNLAHVLADGSLDPAWNPSADAWIACLVLNGGTLYVGGIFRSIGGQARTNLAALDAATGNVTAWNPAPNGRVRALLIEGATVYIGGSFTTIGGKARNSLAAADATTAAVSDWDPNADGDVLALAANGTSIIVGGGFTTIDGLARTGLAAVDAATGSATGWDPSLSPNGFVLSLLHNGATLYVGGWFTSIDGQARNNIAAVDATSGTVSDWNPNASAPVACLALSGAVIYAGGSFTSIGGQTRGYLAALDATTGNATDWDPKPNAELRCMAASGTTVLIGGELSSVGGVPRNHIAALDAATGSPTDWNPNADHRVQALAATGTTVYAGGAFTTIGGQTRKGIAALDATTGSATAWSSGTGASGGGVITLAVSANTVYAGGGFYEMGGQTRRGLAAFDAASGDVTAWNPDANSSVSSVVVSGTTVYVAGYFTSIGGQTRNHIAALDIETGTVLPWDPNANDAVMCLVMGEGTLYAGGAFTSIGGQARNRLAAFSAASGAVTDWNPGANNWVMSLAVNSSTVYAGGRFHTIGGQTRSRIAALDATSAAVTEWAPDADFEIRSLALSGATVYAGGGFTKTSGIPRPYFAQFGEFYPAPVVQSITPATGINNSNVQSTDVRGENFRPQASVFLARAGEVDIAATTISVGSSTQITCTFDLTGAAAGVWDLVVTNEDTKRAVLPGAFTIMAPPPLLVAPIDAATDVSLTPLLTWHGKPEDSLYILQLADSPSFDSPLVNDSLLTDTSATLTSALLAKGTTYYWRVAALTKAGEITAFSSSRSFTTLAAPLTVILTAPAPGDTISADSVWLTWRPAAPDVDRYRLGYALDSLFTESTVGSTITDTSSLLRGLQYGSHIWWRVQAHNAAGWGEWSTPAHFRVGLPAALTHHRHLPTAFSFAVSGGNQVLTYALPSAEHVSLRLYHVDGRLLAEYVNDRQQAGRYAVSLQGREPASSFCIAVFRAGAYCRWKPIALVE